MRRASSSSRAPASAPSPQAPTSASSSSRRCPHARREGAGGAPLRQGGGRQRPRAAARRRAPPRERPSRAPPHDRGQGRGRESVPREAQTPIHGQVVAVPFAYYARLTRRQQAVYRKSDEVTEIRLEQPADLHPRVEALQAALRSEDRAATQEASRAVIRGLCEAMGLPPVQVEVLAARPHARWGELHGLYVNARGSPPRSRGAMRPCWPAAPTRRTGRRRSASVTCATRRRCSWRASTRSWRWTTPSSPSTPRPPTAGPRSAST